jgi:hypothetical protein
VGACGVSSVGSCSLAKGHSAWADLGGVCELVSWTAGCWSAEREAVPHRHCNGTAPSLSCKLRGAWENKNTLYFGVISAQNFGGDWKERRRASRPKPQWRATTRFTRGEMTSAADRVVGDDNRLGVSSEHVWHLTVSGGRHRTRLHRRGHYGSGVLMWRARRLSPRCCGLIPYSTPTAPLRQSCSCQAAAARDTSAVQATRVTRRPK